MDSASLPHFPERSTVPGSSLISNKYSVKENWSILFLFDMNYDRFSFWFIWSYKSGPASLIKLILLKRKSPYTVKSSRTLKKKRVNFPPKWM